MAKRKRTPDSTPTEPWTDSGSIKNVHAILGCGHTELVCFVAEDRARVEAIMKAQAGWKRKMSDPQSCHYDPTPGCSECVAQGRAYGDFIDFADDRLN